MHPLTLAIIDIGYHMNAMALRARCPTVAAQLIANINTQDAFFLMTESIFDYEPLPPKLPNNHFHTVITCCGGTV